MLGDPAGKVIAPGGHIVFVIEAGAAVGCCALMSAMPDGGFEVAKMAVDEAYKGRGLGRALIAACVERARAARRAAPLSRDQQRPHARARALPQLRFPGDPAGRAVALRPRRDVTMELRL